MFAIHICSVGVDGNLDGKVNGWYKNIKVIKNNSGEGADKYRTTPMILPTPTKTYKSLDRAMEVANSLPEKLKIYMPYAPNIFSTLGFGYACLYRIVVVDLETQQTTMVFPRM